MTDDASHRAVVVIPTYNNAGTLVNVVERVAAIGLPVIVVNDGCTDDSASRLKEHLASTSTDVEIVTHPRNRGKAAALASGFHRARSMNATHAVTIDSDLQHDPEDIPGLLAASRQSPEALIVGARRDDLDGMPARSLIGRRLSNRAVLLASGVRVTDSQSGLRVYPLDLVEAAKCRSGHFGFETEIIVRAGWLGRPTVEEPITSRYLPPEQRVSHFRPCLDSWRAVLMHTRLLALSPVRRRGGE